jgi:magnesium-transporting ATPase (P-type)
MKLETKRTGLGTEGRWYKQRTDPTWEHLSTVLGVLSLGIMPLYYAGFPEAKVLMFYESCTPIEAEVVFVDVDGSSRVAWKIDHYNVPRTDGSGEASAEEHVLAFDLDDLRVFGSSLDAFQLRILPECPSGFKKFLLQEMGSYGVEKELDIEKSVLRTLYGPNEIVVPAINYTREYLTALVHPIIIICILGFIVWMMQKYYIFSGIFGAAVVVVLYYIVADKAVSLDNIRKIIDTGVSVNMVGRSGDVRSVHSDNLVVGERVQIEAGMAFNFDMVLIRGRVVLDESKMTGESIPRTKVPPQDQDLEIGEEEQRCILGAKSLIRRAEKEAEIRAATAAAEDAADAAATTDTGETSRARATAYESDVDKSLSFAVMYGGTTVMHATEDAMGVVYRTGFRTTKGNMVSTLLSPPEQIRGLQREIVLLVLIIAVASIVGYSIVSSQLIKAGAGLVYWLYYLVGAISIAVPVTLLVCSVVAALFVTGLLKEQNISTFHPSTIFLGGYTNIVSFDKTGTLTEDNLLFESLVVSNPVLRMDMPRLNVQSEMDPVAAELRQGPVSMSEIDTRLSDEPSTMIPPLVQEIMATCHSIGVMDTQSGFAAKRDYVGDPLDLELARASGWVLHPPSNNTNNLVCADPPVLSPVGGSASAVAQDAGRLATGYRLMSRERRLILRTFDFSAERMRSGVLVRRPNGSMYYYVKGAAEVVIALCSRESVPANTDSTLSTMSRKGLRVLAIAYRLCRDPLAASMAQDNLESGEGGLIFVGLLCLSNSLRPESAKVVGDLKKAGICVNMITGDNVFAAVTTARRCGILGPLVDETTSAPPRLVPRSLGDKATSSGHIKSGAVGRVYIIEGARDLSKDDDIQVTDSDTGRPMDLDLKRVVEEAVICKYRQRQRFVKQAIKREAEERASTSGTLLSLGILNGTADPDPAAAPLTPPASAASTYGTIPEMISAVETGGAGVDEEQADAVDDSFVELAVTSSALVAIQAKYPDGLLLNTICRTAKVFARAQPKDKKFVVDEVTRTPRGLKFTRGSSLSRDDVLFCGDGANDMEAMHTATLGVSLCDTEVSIAAPITSWSRSPSAVLHVLTKGRWGLSLVYSTLHATVLSSVIWLTQELIMLWFLTESTNCMYSVLDCYVLVLQTAILLDAPKDDLTVAQMPKHYFGWYLCYQLVPQCVIFLGFQIIAIVILENCSFYTPYTTDDVGDVLESTAYVPTVEQNVTLGQMIIAAVLSYIGEPFRRDWTSNYLFTGLVIVGALWTTYQCFAGGSAFAVDFLGLVETPVYFGWVLVSLLSANAVLCYIVKGWTESLTRSTLYKSHGVPLFSEELERKSSRGDFNEEYTLG